MFAVFLSQKIFAEDASQPQPDQQAAQAAPPDQGGQAAPPAQPVEAQSAQGPAPDAQAAQAAPPAAPAGPSGAAAPAAASPAPAGSGGTEAKTATTEKKEGEKDKNAEDEPAYDFEHEDTFIDVPDALRSRQFVHRAILSTIIRDTARVKMGSMYFNQILGFNAIYQPANRGGKSFAKYASGVLGFSLGYSTKGGHALEAGLDLSSTSQLLIGYKYYFQSETTTFWPFLGGGLSIQVPLNLSDPPVEAVAYQGKTTGEYISVGAIIPLVDIALRAEAKFVFDGLDRLILDTGVGATFFF
jgi:hypothetical protein